MKPESIHETNRRLRIASAFFGISTVFMGGFFYRLLTKDEKLRIKMRYSEDQGHVYMLDAFYRSSKYLSGIDYRQLDDSKLQNMQKESD